MKSRVIAGILFELLGVFLIPIGQSQLILIDRASIGYWILGFGYLFIVIGAVFLVMAAVVSHIEVSKSKAQKPGSVFEIRKSRSLLGGEYIVLLGDQLQEFLNDLRSDLTSLQDSQVTSKDIDATVTAKLQPVEQLLSTKLGTTAVETLIDTTIAPIQCQVNDATTEHDVERLISEKVNRIVEQLKMTATKSEVMKLIDQKLMPLSDEIAKLKAVAPEPPNVPDDTEKNVS